MNEHSDINANSWLRRLTHLLKREPEDSEELREVLRQAEQRNLMNPRTLAIIEGALQISEMQVRDIMLPRAQMIAVRFDMQPAELIPLVIESGHSRFPVLDEHSEEVLGILLAKDLLAYCYQPQKENFVWREILRPAVFVPESKRLDVLLQEFRHSRNHMAIVVDEYGTTAGLVTIEDVLEQIVGEIDDEYDIDDETMIKPLHNSEYIVKALTPIADFNEYFHTAFADDEFDTIGGIVLQAFGHLPKRGETITIANIEFKILHADNRRIRLLSVKSQ